MNFPKGRDAFTLMELMTVMAIIVILIGLLFPGINKVRQQAKKQKAKAMIGSLEVAINMYYTDIGKYPEDNKWSRLVSGGAGNYGPYMDTEDYDQQKQAFLDPWGTPYEYTQLNGVVTITSYGPDEKKGTDDDITN